MSHHPDSEDVRLRFGMDPPRLEEREYWGSLKGGADEYPTPRVGVLRATVIRHGSTLIRLSTGVASEDADGDA